MNNTIIHELGHLIMYLIMLTKHSNNKKNFMELVRETFNYISINRTDDYAGIVSVSKLSETYLLENNRITFGSFILGGVFFNIYYFNKRNKIKNLKKDTSSIRNLIINEGGKRDLELFDEYVNNSGKCDVNYYIFCILFIKNILNSREMNIFINTIKSELLSKKILYSDDIIRISQNYFNTFSNLSKRSFDGDVFTKFRIKFWK